MHIHKGDTHTCMHTHIHMHTHTYTCIMYTHTQTYTFPHTCTHITHILTCTFTCMYPHTCTYITHTHLHIHTHIFTHTHTHSHTLTYLDPQIDVHTLARIYTIHMFAYTHRCTPSPIHALTHLHTHTHSPFSERSTKGNLCGNDAGFFSTSKIHKAAERCAPRQLLYTWYLILPFPGRHFLVSHLYLPSLQCACLVMMMHYKSTLHLFLGNHLHTITTVPVVCIHC